MRFYEVGKWSWAVIEKWRDGQIGRVFVCVRVTLGWKNSTSVSVSANEHRFVVQFSIESNEVRSEVMTRENLVTFGHLLWKNQEKCLIVPPIRVKSTRIKHKLWKSKLSKEEEIKKISSHQGAKKRDETRENQVFVTQRWREREPEDKEKQAVKIYVWQRCVVDMGEKLSRRGK